jgi:2-polyprenyl-3-methyl-5-hydroxy-6-metoxy-1,4-benzoquinol methylase
MHMKRFREPELMDDPALEEERHLLALKGLERINAVSGSARQLWGPLRAWAKETGTHTLSVLDIASGGGDVPIGLDKLATREGIGLSICGSDLSKRAIEYASARAAQTKSPVTFITLDVLKDPLPSGFDVITNSLFMHHLSDDEVVLLLTKMSVAANKMVLINDLSRSRVGLAMAYLGTRLLSASDVVHYDGMISIKAAYTPEEFRELAERAGLSGCTVERRWPTRFLLQWKKP